jgi:SAM-dependent methyltransferase
MTKMLFKKIADMREADSLITQLRRRRFVLFRTLLDSLPRPVRLLDVGGTQFFWEMMGFRGDQGLEVTMLNLMPSWTRPGFRSVVGDARNMHQFADQEFDVVFSNSVIEHVGEPQAQQQVASEIKRVGKRYFVQTPNRHFPLEPHFFFPGFQFLPLAARIWLVQHFDLGWYKKIPNYVAARQEVETIRLLSRRDVTRLFPEGTLYNERFAGLTVSFVIYAGWPARTNEPKAYANLTK